MTESATSLAMAPNEVARTIVSVKNDFMDRKVGKVGKVGKV